MEWILRKAISHRTFIILLVLLLTVLGIGSWNVLQKEAYPDIGDTQVIVITEFPGRAAAEVETQVTIPLERVLSGVPRVLTRRSKTIFGLSVIYLTFEEGAQDYWARARVLEKLPEASLPEGTSPHIAPLTGPVGEILRYTLEGQDEHTPMELRTLQDWTISPKLLQAPGVADVITFGGLVRQYHVITTPEKLIKYHLSLPDVIESVTKNNLSTGGNVIQRGGQGFIVRGIGAIQKKEDIENIVVASNRGVPVFIRDLGTVEIFPMPPSGILGYAMKPTIHSKPVFVASGVQGLIAMRRGENASQVVQTLKEKVKEINQELPQGIQLVITYDRGELVHYTIRTVTHTLFEGISTVIIILILFLGSLRSALVVATTIPLSLLFAFFMMKLTGIPANLLSLGAIDFGIIVDGAVVMVENIFRRYRSATPKERQEGIAELTWRSANEVSREIFFSIIIIIAAYLPIFTFQRVEGKLFSPMAYTLAFAITGSMIFALTLIPGLMCLLFRHQFEFKNNPSFKLHSPIFSWIENKYNQKIGLWISESKKIIFLSFSFVLAVVLLGAFKLGTEFLPELDEGSINIRCFFPVGISLQEANRYTPIIRESLIAHQPVKTVITQLGRNEEGTDPYSPNRLEILVELHDYTLWKGGMNKEKLLLKMKTELEEKLPGVHFSFSQPILDNVTEAMTGSVSDLAILIQGEDLKLMRKLGNQILELIQKIPGATEYGIEQEADQAQLVVDLKRREIARFGINVSDVQHIIEAAIGGKSIGSLYEGGKRFDIVVRYKTQYRSSLDAIQNLPVVAPNGARIPLAQLASIRLLDGPTLIQRQDGKRQLSVRTNIHGRDQGSFVKEAQAIVSKEISLPRGYSVTWGGQFENLERSAARLKVVIPFTLTLIFAILFLLYRNFWQVSIAFSCIPFSVAGGILALLLRGYHFNVSAGVGFISLFGISTMSGVLFVSRMRHLLKDEPHLTLREQVKKAALLQLRPRLTTVLPALFGLIPAALATGVGSDVQRPLATVMVGGLCSELILTIIALPGLYLLVQEWSEKQRLRDPEKRKFSLKFSLKKITLLFLAGIGSLSEGSSCWADRSSQSLPEGQPLSLPLSLEEAETLFQKKNLDLIASKFNLEASEGATLQAGLWPNPNFAIEQNIYNPLNDRYFDYTNSGNTELQIQQLFSLTGRFSKNEKVAEMNQEVARLEYFDTLRCLKLKLRSTFYSLFFLKQTLSFFETQIPALKKTIESSEKLASARSILPSEVLRLKSLLLSLQSDRQATFFQYQDLQSDLRILLAESPNFEKDFHPTLNREKVGAIQLDFNLNQAIEAARSHRPDLKIAQANVILEETNLSLQKALALPDFTVGLHYSRAGSYISEYYGLTIAFDLPVFQRNQGNIFQSSRSLLKLTQLKDKAILGLEKDVGLAFYKARNIDRQFQEMDQNLARDYESLAYKMFQAYEKRDLGTIAFADFLESYRNSVNQLNQFQMNRLIAFEELNYAVGTDLIQIKK